MTTRTLSELLKQLDVMTNHNQPTTDEIEFQWMGNEELINLALDYEKVKVLEDDDKEALIYILGRRLEQLIFDDSQD